MLFSSMKGMDQENQRHATRSKNNSIVISIGALCSVSGKEVHDMEERLQNENLVPRVLCA